MSRVPNKGNVTIYCGKSGSWWASRFGEYGEGRTKRLAKAALDAKLRTKQN